ncbi:hypothetical protein WJM97_21390 [Okeanomitos corallinicola TIOX110]|uniref:Uncharacterized protein n=1 Tax=Okeanomitos corallinicola TIOX110 TaxID=3133117 RepID=A0ABZ2US07_9CYAN
MFSILEQLKQWLSQSNQTNENQNINQKQKQVIESPSPKIETHHIQPENLEESILETSNSTSIEKFEKIETPINTPTYKSVPKTLQDQLNELQANATLSLWPPNGEYTGPIIINHPVVLDGKGATIWATKGPVLSISSEQVTIRNLKIEVTGETEIDNSENNCAILVKSVKNLNFENIEVRGSVMGLSEEEGEWQYPSVLNIGRIAYGKEYNFICRVIVPVQCQIISEISGIDFNNLQLIPGKNEINIHIEKLPQDTLINGSIYLVSANLKRRISLTAHIVSLLEPNTSAIDNDVIWEAESWSSFVEEITSQNINIIDVSEKESVSEPKLIINQPTEKAETLLQNNSVKIEKNNESITTHRTYIEVKPNPIFSLKIDNTNQQKNQTSQIETTNNSQQQSSINPIFEQFNSSQIESKQQNIPPVSEVNNSPTINPLFQHSSPVNNSINSDQVNQKDSSQQSNSKTNPQARKRTQAKPNNIFMGDMTKKEEPNK